jgi:hypothetical protein
MGHHQGRVGLDIRPQSILGRLTISQAQFQVQVHRPILAQVPPPPPNTHIFYIYYIAILQKYIVRHKFCNSIHLPPCPRRQGYNVVSHGGRSRQEWARLGAIRHGVRGLAPWATTTAGLLAPWATTLESGCLSNTEIQPKMS